MTIGQKRIITNLMDANATPPHPRAVLDIFLDMYRGYMHDVKHPLIDALLEDGVSRLSSQQVRNALVLFDIMGFDVQTLLHQLQAEKREELAMQDAESDSSGTACSTGLDSAPPIRARVLLRTFLRQQQHCTTGERGSTLYLMKRHAYRLADDEVTQLLDIIHTAGMPIDAARALAEGPLRHCVRCHAAYADAANGSCACVVCHDLQAANSEDEEALEGEEGKWKCQSCGTLGRASEESGGEGIAWEEEVCHIGRHQCTKRGVMYGSWTTKTCREMRCEGEDPEEWATESEES